MLTNSNETTNLLFIYIKQRVYIYLNNIVSKLTQSPD